MTISAPMKCQWGGGNDRTDATLMFGEPDLDFSGSLAYVTHATRASNQIYHIGGVTCRSMFKRDSSSRLRMINMGTSNHVIAMNAIETFKSTLV